MEKALTQAPESQRKGIVFLVANMSDRDLKSLHADFLLENVDLAYRVRKEAAWVRESLTIFSLTTSSPMRISTSA